MEFRIMFYFSAATLISSTPLSLTNVNVCELFTTFSFFGLSQAFPSNVTSVFSFNVKYMREAICTLSHKA